MAGLESTRAAVEAGAPWPLADDFDNSDEARWGPPEVLAHLAEMVAVLAGRDRARDRGAAVEPVPFGRVATDTLRIGVLGARPVAAAARAVRPDRRANSARLERRWATLTPAELSRRASIRGSAR